MWWKEPITALKGVGPKKAEDFANLNITTIGDLLNFFPRQGCYLDYSKTKTIKELTLNGETQVFKGTIVRMLTRRSARSRSFATVTVSDETGFADVYLFAHQRFQLKAFEVGEEIMVAGKVGPGRGAKSVTSAILSHMNSQTKPMGILPVYSLSGSLTQNQVRGAVKQALALAQKELPESLPGDVIKAKG